MDWKSALVGALSRFLRPGIRSKSIALPLTLLLRGVAPRRGVARQNYDIVLPLLSAEEKERMLSGTYSHLVWTALEFIMLQRDPAQVLEWTDVEGEEYLRESDGAILLTGHVGNWELTAAWIAQAGYPVTGIVRESDDPSERGLIHEMRSRVGVRSLSKSAPMTRAVSLLKRGELLGILPDQHGGRDGIEVPFFGVKTSTSPGAAVFAYLTRRPLIPVFSQRISPCRHKIRFGPPLEWEKLGSRDETVADITRKVNGVMEQMVLEAPDQWLAQHKRFKEVYTAAFHG